MNLLDFDIFATQLPNSGNDMDLIRDAFEYATEKHASMRRKNSNDPYIIHPIRVALAVRDYGQSMIIAGLLHDVVEDTETSIEDIESRFGYQVSRLVYGMTKTDNKTLFQVLSEVIPEFPEIIVLKLADRFDNMTDHFEEMPEKTKQRYKKETPQILEIAENNNVAFLVQELRGLLKF